MERAFFRHIWKLNKKQYPTIFKTRLKLFATTEVQAKVFSAVTIITLLATIKLAAASGNGVWQAEAAASRSFAVACGSSVN